MNRFNLQKMPSFVFTIGILSGLTFVPFPCEGTISLPPGGETVIVLPGENATIVWTFNNTITLASARTWLFTSSQGGQLRDFAVIPGTNGQPILDKSVLPEFDIETPATLILRNVDDRYDGTYTFFIFPDSSSVRLYVAAKPTVTIGCSNTTIVDECENVACPCTSEGGNSPANVTWYKDGMKVDTKDEENRLTLTNVTGADNGTYKCVAQSYILKDEESFVLKVRPNFSPVVKSVLPSETVAVLGKSFTITCVASGRPAPTYIIKHNTKVVSPEKTTNKYTIPTVNCIHAGSYECIARNKLGESSKTFTLTVIAPVPTTTVAAPTSNSSNIVAMSTANACHQCGSVVVWHALVFLLSGFIIGVLLACIVATVYFRRRYRNKKPARSNPAEQQTTSKVDSIYQDLDLSKMNQEENYQTLRAVNSGNGQSDYTELNLVRDVEDNYQSLT